MLKVGLIKAAISFTSPGVNPKYSLYFISRLVRQSGSIIFFEGGFNKEEAIKYPQWLNAILSDIEPLVKPEQAFMVTKILENIYKFAREGREIKF